jgi:hypothetical protein
VLSSSCVLCRDFNGLWGGGDWKELAAVTVTGNLCLAVISTDNPLVDLVLDRVSQEKLNVFRSGSVGHCEKQKVNMSMCTALDGYWDRGQHCLGCTRSPSVLRCPVMLIAVWETSCRVRDS